MQSKKQSRVKVSKSVKSNRTELVKVNGRCYLLFGIRTTALTFGLVKMAIVAL